MDKTLDQLIDDARTRRMTSDEQEAQRVSFAFGNAPEEDNGTMETVKAAATIIRNTEAA